MMHVLVYAEILFRWKLLHKRIELLKAVDPFLRLPSDSSFNFDHSQLGTPLVFYIVYRCPLPPPPFVMLTRTAVFGQAYPFSARDAANRRILTPNRRAIPVAPVSACPDVLYAACQSKVRSASVPLLIIPS
jgi:hypothetical protein